MKKSNLQCKCGHEREMHMSAFLRRPIGCTVHIFDDAINVTGCFCTGFKLDNLSYIEKLAKERGLV
jgi:hypothetical protein